MLIVSNEQRSGSVGATTYAKNRFGMYARQRVVPVNPNTERQVQARSRMSLLTNLWNTTLTPAERDGWNSYAANVPMLNRLGQTIYVTGFNMYIRTNSLVLQAGLTRVDTPPGLFLKGESDPTFAITVSEATQLISVAFDNALDWAGEVGGALMVFAGSPVMTALNFFGGPWKYAGKVVGAVVPPTSPVTIACPQQVLEDQKLWVQARVVRADGRVSDPFSGSCSVGA